MDGKSSGFAECKNWKRLVVCGGVRNHEISRTEYGEEQRYGFFSKSFFEPQHSQTLQKISWRHLILVRSFL